MNTKSSALPELNSISFYDMSIVSFRHVSKYSRSICVINVWPHHELWNDMRYTVSVRPIGNHNETRRGRYVDWRLFQVSEQKLIKWFRKSCPKLELALRLNWVMPTSLPASVVLYLQHPISKVSQNLHFLPFKYCNSIKFQLVDFRRHCILVVLQYIKRRKCMCENKVVGIKQLMQVVQLAWPSLNVMRI